MKRRIIFSLISLILAVAMVITALSSCSADNSSLILCNVKLEEDEYSRRLTSTVTSNTISASAIYYHPEYLGTGNSYSEINSDKTSITDDVTGEKYILYNDGILLSQGLWNIKCKWTDESGKTVLEGETGPTWINLNTEKIYIRFGACSLSLTYSVTCKETISPYIVLNLYSFENGNISSSALSGYENITLSKDSITTISSETTSDNTTINTNKNTFKKSFDSFNKSGTFVLVLQIKDENDNSESVLFTDVIGFLSRLGSTITLKGSCEIEDNNIGGSCIYLPDISDPTDPTEMETITITNDPAPNDDTQGKLNEVEIQDDKVYIVTPDDINSSDPSMNLGHTTVVGEETKKTNRILTPSAGTNFGINLNGTDVCLTSESTKVSKVTESSLIIELPTDTEMTLYNYDTIHTTNPQEAIWANMYETKYYSEVFGIYLGSFKRRFESNVSMTGGTLNIVGNHSPSSISNASVIFRGPVASDSNETATLASSDYCKQGAINIFSPGGTINIDGNVRVDASVGISSWSTSTNSGNYKSTIDAALNCNINIKNGASIEAVGDENNQELSGKPIWKDTAAGIYILGNEKSGTINIVLDNGQITTTGSGTYDSQNYPSVFEAGIRIENFTGSINIELKNGSTISSDNGYGIYLNNCTGGITIKKDNNSSITGTLSPVYIDGSAQQFSNGEITKSATSSSTSV